MALGQRKETMEVTLLGKAPWADGRVAAALRGKKEALGQEEKQDVGDTMDESLVLTGAFTQLLVKELHVHLCALAHSSELQEANRFCHLFPRVSGAWRVSLGCVIKASAPC